MHVLLVCKVNAKIGYGHLKRCISIGEYISTIGGKVSIALLDSEPNCKIDINFSHSLYHAHIQEGSSKSKKWPKELKTSYNLVILDVIHNKFFQEYTFDNICTYFAPITEQLVAIDSIGEQSIIAKGCASLASKVIIPYAISDDSKYQEKKIICGSKYAILSSEYKTCLNREYRKRANNILISTGGSDNRLYSKIIMKTVENLGECFNIRLIIGPLFNPVYAQELKKYDTNMNVTIVESPKSLYDHMIWSDLAISASGGTKYELAATGTPAILFSWTENDYMANKDFSKLGSCIDIGVGINEDKLSDNLKILISKKGIREQMGVAGRKITDGNGIGNIFDQLGNTEGQ